jgi:hypothetical protein
LALGLAVGLIGFQFTSDSAWFIAIPAVLAVGWFAIADPTQCLPPGRASPRTERRRRIVAK